MSQFENFAQIAGGPLIPHLLAAENATAGLFTRLNKALEPVPEVATGLVGTAIAGATALGAKTLGMLPWEWAKSTGAMGEAVLGGAARLMPVAGPMFMAIEAGRYDRRVRDETARTWDSPQAQALPDLGRQSWGDFLWGRAPACEAPLPDGGPAGRAAHEASPPRLDLGSSSPLHVIVDGQGPPPTPAGSPPPRHRRRRRRPAAPSRRASRSPW